MGDALVIVILLVLIGLSAGYTHKIRKKSEKCKGCPYGDTCPGKANGNSCDEENQK